MIRSFTFAIFCIYNAVDVSAFLIRSPSHTCREIPTSLAMGGSDRARFEKSLEDMMGNDWRMFRAQLVAQEMAEKRHSDHTKHEIASSRQAQRRQMNPRPQWSQEKRNARPQWSQDDTHSHYQKRQVQSFGQPIDEKLAKQETFGNIFTTIFNGNREVRPERSERSIFEGHHIGGATPNSMIPESCEDPFVSVAELPVLMKPKVRVDKHRWAHPLTHLEPGAVLIANEKLGGVFHQTVVLVIEHHEGIGTTGIVINRPLQGDLLKIATETRSNVDLSLKLAFNSAPVSYGGPVLQEEYSVLHGYGNVEGSKKVAPGVFVGGSEELMQEVRKRNLHPNDTLFVKGHAAWVPNQLAREISKGVWYPASCSSDFLLRYAGAPVSEDDNEVDLWSDILSCMGDEYEEIAKAHGGKGDMRMMP